MKFKLGSPKMSMNSSVQYPVYKEHLYHFEGQLGLISVFFEAAVTLSIPSLDNRHRWTTLIRFRAIDSTNMRAGKPGIIYLNYFEMSFE